MLQIYQWAIKFDTICNWCRKSAAYKCFSGCHDLDIMLYSDGLSVSAGVHTIVKALSRSYKAKKENLKGHVKGIRHESKT